MWIKGQSRVAIPFGPLSLLVRTPRPQSFHGSEGKERGVPLGPPVKEHIKLVVKTLVMRRERLRTYDHLQSFHGSEGKERGVPLGPPVKEHMIIRLVRSRRC